jgi:drug/metabolite transporter (DMT)-like permease
LLYLVGSIVLTSLLTLSFKVIERFRIPVLQAIVFNYFTCVIAGSLVNGSSPLQQITSGQPWLWWAMLMGLFFIGLFNVIGFTVQKAGVAVASVANKLSLVIPFIFSIILYNESTTWLRVIGIVLAVLSVLLTCWPSKNDQAKTGKQLSRGAKIALPLLLFVGSGLLDTMVKYVEQTYLNETNHNAYLVSAFATAGLLGTISLIALLLAGKQKFDKRSILAGIIIGIPNYFSIWCLVALLKKNTGESSAIIPINNMGIVLFSSVMAFLLFRERLTAINWAGIILSIAAIALIAFG